MTYVDIDDTVRATHGYLKQGSGFGYTGVRGLNVLLGTISTPLAAPVIAGTRLRKGSADSARGAARLIADTLVTAKSVGADPRRGAKVLLRADTAFYVADVVAAARRAGAQFSVGARMTATVKEAITGISADAWTAPPAAWPAPCTPRPPPPTWGRAPPTWSTLGSARRQPPPSSPRRRRRGAVATDAPAPLPCAENATTEMISMIAFLVMLVSLLAQIVVVLFNRPRVLVPPYLRSERGLLR